MTHKAIQSIIRRMTAVEQMVALSDKMGGERP